MQQQTMLRRYRRMSKFERRMLLGNELKIEISPIKTDSAPKSAIAQSRICDELKIFSFEKQRHEPGICIISLNCSNAKRENFCF